MDAPGEITALRFSPNNQALIGTAGKNTVVAWDAIYTAGQMTPEDFLKTLQVFNHPDITDAVIGADKPLRIKVTDDIAIGTPIREAARMERTSSSRA